MIPKVKSARFLAAATNVAELPPPMFAELAFAGRSNVGKSSLINSLLSRRRLVRTSGIPGCTRGLNLFRVELDVGVLDLVDLPGYGYAKRSKAERLSWQPMIEGFLRYRAGLRGIVLIIDVRRGVTEEDRTLIAFATHIHRQLLLVGSKVDKISRSRRKTTLEALGAALQMPILPYSAETGEGRDALWAALLELSSLPG